MAPRSPQDTIVTLRDVNKGLQDYIDELEDERERLHGRLDRIQGISSMADDDPEAEDSDEPEGDET